MDLDNIQKEVGPEIKITPYMDNETYIFDLRLNIRQICDSEMIRIQKLGHVNILKLQRDIMIYQLEDAVKDLKRKYGLE